MIRIGLILTCLILNGCATTIPRISNLNTSLSTSQADLNENTGILVGTYTKNVGDKEYNNRRFFFTDTESYESRYVIDKKYQSDNVSLVSLIAKHKYTIEDNGKEGDAFAFVLPAGEYAFYNFNLQSNTGNGTETWSSERPYSIPFVVHPNKVNYVGEINFTAITKDRKTIIGIKTHDKRGGFWHISDELERDKVYISEKFTGLPVNNIENVVPQENKGNTPFVILPNQASETVVSSSDTGSSTVVSDAFSAWSLSCKKPYVLKQDCSLWTGAKKKLVVDGFKLKVAGSEDGKTILVMEKGASYGISGQQSFNLKDLKEQETPINSSYYSIKKVFDDSGITINKARPIKPSVGISGYILLLDKEGYTLLDKYSAKKK